jgi:hypothetical protein
MTEYNGKNRHTQMTGVHEISSHSSASSSVNQDMSREVSIVGIMELSNEQHELSLSSNSSSSNPILNDSNQSIHSYTQPPSIQPPLPSTDTYNNHPTNSITPSSTESLVPSSESSFAQLAFQKFETYISETRVDQIAPLQEIICGYGVGLARLAQSTHNQLQSANTQWQPQHPHPQQGQFLEPIALRRHIHSTPLLRHTANSTLPAINDEDECDFDSDEDYPPPAGLEILDFLRSRSTPLTTSENSAFGTILRTSSHSVINGYTISNKSQGNCGGSAFSLPPYAMKKAQSRSDERAARPVIFNPIVHEDEILKTVDGENPLGEMTSIEVTNVPLPIEEQEKRPAKKKIAVSRTAKFLTDVRNLRITSGNGSKRLNGGGSGRRNRRRDGRENPARPASISSDEHSRSSTIASSAAGSNDTTERNDPVRPVIVAISACVTSENIIERTTTSLDATKKAISKASSGNDRVRIQVNYHAGNSIDVGSRQSYSASSPDPSEVLDQADQSYASHSRDSPNSTRFPPSISNSSGRASHGTSTSSNALSHGSHLSSISETDREVANVNLLQRDRKLQIVGEQIELSLSSDRSIRYGDLNGSISIASPDSNIRRDGASVRADRFFNYTKDSNRLRHLPPFSKRSGSAQSPTAGSSSASVTTSSSSASDEPPKIVSYMDRKQISDLSSLHHRQHPFETSSPRADHDQEVRDSSPSEQILAEHSEIVFEGAHPAQIDVCNRPRPYWPGRSIPTVFVRKNRSLPPRSPCNSILPPTTPPPQVGSPAYNTISPPRQIFGHRIDPLSTNLSKPYVVAPISYCSNSKKSIFTSLSVPVTDINCALLPDANQVPYDEALRLSPNCDYYNLKPAARGLSPVYGQQGSRTYEESSIEILKSDSKDDNAIPLVTPDKGNPPP